MWSNPAAEKLVASFSGSCVRPRTSVPLVSPLPPLRRTYMQFDKGQGRLPSSRSLPVITTNPRLMTAAGTSSKLPPFATRPLTPFMQHELSRIIVKDTTLREAAAASMAAEVTAKAKRKAKYAPGPKVLRISQIKCEGLPDADKSIGGGTSDPYLRFMLSSSGGQCEARTQTVKNARQVAFPDVLELPVPDPLIRGKCRGTLVVQVWDDDSFEDGGEGVSEDDLMGYNEYQLECRLRPYRLEGQVDRATFMGIGNLYAFRVSFRYDAVPAPVVRCGN